MSEKINATKVADNDLMALVTYVKVAQNRSGNELRVCDVDDEKNNFSVIGKSLIEKMLSADQYVKEEKVTKTRAAEILSTSFNKPFTVLFIKSDDSMRILRGRLLKTEPLMGRSYVEDLDIVEENKTRLIDHREIVHVIVDNTKYIVK